jgi:squalene synthase HpnC
MNEVEKIVSSRAGASLVRQDLLRFGPQNCPVRRLLPTDVAEGYLSKVCSNTEAQVYCLELARSHYENFSVLSYLIPRRLRQDVANIYAYCRWTDDLADEMDSTAQSQYLLDWWSGLLGDCFEGDALHPVFVALRTTIEKHNLSAEPFEALIGAFIQDQTKTRYDSDRELDQYCEGSANPVGRLLLALADVRDEESQRASDAICTGLQIVNFCQDIRLDALRGRIYLPKSRWGTYSLEESDIMAGRCTESLRRTLAEWCRAAEQRLIEGLPLVRRVPYWLARNVQLFARGGLALLREIEARNYDVWSRTIEVKRSTKIRLLLRGWVRPRSLHAERLRGI